MKRILIFVLLILLVGCDTNNDSEKIKILVPSGIPLIAIGDLIGNDNVIIENVGGPDLLTSAMTSKSHDIIIAPINLGAKLYINNSSSYHLNSIITFGNSYIVSRKINSLSSINDINNQELLAYAQSSIPSLILNAAIAENDINCSVNYKTSVDLVFIDFLSNPDNPNDISSNPPEYILSAEPLISKMMVTYNLDLNIYDLQDSLRDDLKIIPQAAIFINSESEKDISKVIDLIKENIEFLNSNPEEYAKKIVNKNPYFTNLGEEVLKTSIPRSNIEFMNAQQNKNDIEEYFKFLNLYNPKLMDNQIPNENFYN